MFPHSCSVQHDLIRHTRGESQPKIMNLAYNHVKFANSKLQFDKHRRTHKNPKNKNQRKGEKNKLELIDDERSNNC